MPTKAELEAELAATSKKLASAEKRLAKAKEKAKEAPVVEASDDVSEAANNLVDGILKRGVDVQVGQKQLRLMCEALGREYSRGTG